MRIEDITPEHPRFTEWADVFVTVGRQRWGRDSTAYPPAEVAHMWRASSHRNYGFAAVNAEGRIIGSAIAGLAQLDNTHLVGFDMAVLEDIADSESADNTHGTGRTHGTDHGYDTDEANVVRTSLLDAVETLARENGRTTLLIETQTRSGEENVDADMLRAAGFAPAQQCVRNAQPLPVSDHIAERMRRALDVRDGYRIETCVGRIPDAWLAERARLAGMMSTDTPLGDLEILPESWTPERVTEIFDVDEGRGRTVIEAVAWHEASGRMAAFTHVSVPKETPWVAYQDDTLVEKAHRGHRLGYRVKAAVSLLLPKVAPGVEVQRTWNDETNVHMLRINSELGYEREGTLIEWQKRLG